MVTQNRHFCAKSIENSRKQVKIACFRLFLVEVTGLEPAISSSRTMRDTTFATPRNGKIIRFFVSGQTCGQTENLRTFKTSGEPKSQCFQGLSALLENSTPSVVIESRNWRATNCATPRKNIWKFKFSRLNKALPFLYKLQLYFPKCSARYYNITKWICQMNFIKSDKNFLKRFIND